MFKRILVLLLLLMVEFSTIRNCITSFIPTIEVQDIEDCNENEDVAKEVLVEKFFLAVPSFLFNISKFLSKSIIYDFVATKFSNPYQTIDSPPPKD